ncbi:hypothetical protein HYR53_10380 [Candidatus Acetothermia bacterium]|nr:hypothetical protein [Candidatus Acetothermia bacterium]
MAGSSHKFEVKLTGSFTKTLEKLSKPKQYPRLPHDLRPVLENLEIDPFQGDEIGPAAKYRKIRIKSTDMKKGKSGGFRLFTEPVQKDCIVYVWWIIPKKFDEGFQNDHERISELERRIESENK